MFRHGLRVSEVIDLRWPDFELDAPRDRPFYVRRLKGSKDTGRYCTRTAALGWRRSQYVFRSERGGPLSPDTVQAIVARAGRVADFGFKCHPHMLRHACGFFLADEGTSTRLIQDYLGHRDIKSTVIYGGYGTHRCLIRLKFSPIRAMLHGTISQAVRQFL
jgi:integrase